MTWRSPLFSVMGYLIFALAQNTLVDSIFKFDTLFAAPIGVLIGKTSEFRGSEHNQQPSVRPLTLLSGSSAADLHLCERLAGASQRQRVRHLGSPML